MQGSALKWLNFFLVMSELNQKASIRQLPPGKLNNLKKIFEDGDSSSTKKGEKPAPPARPPPPPTRVRSPIRQQPSQVLSKNVASKQQQKVSNISEAVGQTVQLTSQIAASGHVPDKVTRPNNSADHIQKAKTERKVLLPVSAQFPPSSDNAHFAQTFSSHIEKSTPPQSMPAQPPKPATRHLHDTVKEEVYVDNPLYSSFQGKPQNVTDIYAKVNKPKKETDNSSKKVNFNSQEKGEIGLHRREAVKKNVGERRKTIAGCSTDDEETEVGNVSVAERLKLFNVSKEDKPTVAHKPDSLTRKFSMRTPKEFENEQHNECVVLKKVSNESEEISLYDPPWDLNRSSALDKLMKMQSPPHSSKLENINNERTKSADMTHIFGAASRKQVFPSNKTTSTDNDLVVLRNQLQSKTVEVPPASSPQKKVAPPAKPPRTHAHDDYLKVKVIVSQNTDTKGTSKGPGEHEIRTVQILDASSSKESQEETEHLSIKDRISKLKHTNEPTSAEPPPLPPPISLARRNAEQTHAPSRPPPPKRRPNSGDSQHFSHGPVIIPVPPRSHLPLGKQVSDESHTRRPGDQLPPAPQVSTPMPRFPLRKSHSSECLHSSHTSSLNGELDDEDNWALMSQSSYGSQYEAVIDPEGYAVPNVFMRVPGKKRPSIKDDSLDVEPSNFLTRLKGFGVEDAANKPETSPSRMAPAQEQNLDNVNKKKMNMVKQKINQAYADLYNLGLNSQTNDSEWQIIEQQSINESVIEPTVLKKRIEYCTSVRLKSSKSIKHCKEYMDTIYPQLFEYCLVVGLQQLVNTEGYQPYVIHKFPENVSSNWSVPNFCFPDATIFKPGSATSVSDPYSFVMTYADGSRVFGYCRRVQPTDSSLPEVICIISPIDAFNMYNTLLNEIATRRSDSLDQALELIAASFGRPLPKSGKVCHIRTLNVKGEMETIFLHRSSDNKLDNVNYESPLHYLGTDRLVKVFSSMLIERRIILCSSNLSVLTQTVYALSALLYPFQWQHVYIPLLPHEMLDVLCAPVPFIVGLLTAYLPKVLKLELEEVFIVDLDKKNIVKCQDDESTILPRRIQKALKTAINMCKIDAEARNTQWLMVAEAFLRMFIETVGHFNNHIHTQQDGNRVFQKDSFIQGVASKEVREFLSWFSETQMFEVFILNHVEKTDCVTTNDLFLQRLTEYKESKEESNRHRGLGAKVKNFGKALKTKLQAS